MKERAVTEEAMKCVDQLCAEFVEDPLAAYLENSLHARLFHLLTVAGLAALERTLGGYRTFAVQREYPTIEKELGKRSRGKLDLVVFDRDTVRSIDWWKHDRFDPRTRKGVPLPPTVAIEVGLNKGLAGGRTLVKREVYEAEKEVRRLANPGNRVSHGLLLYFYRYVEDSTQHQAKSLDAILGYLRRWAERRTRENSRTTARVVCVRIDRDADFAPRDSYELAVVRGHARETGVPPLTVLTQLGGIR